MILYLLKFTLCSATLLLFYRVFLEREKVFRFNRFYLLGSLVLSLVLPLVSFEVPSEQSAFFPSASHLSFEESTLLLADPTFNPSETTPSASMGWMELVGIGYLLVVGYLLFRFVRNSFVLLNRARQSAVVRQEDSKLVLLDVPTLPHSFLNYVFLNKASYLDGNIEAEILCHERAHVRQRHTLDVLFVELMRALFWVNPALYFYRRAIVLNHEYLADAEVLEMSQSISAYQHLLLRQSARPVKMAFASQFNFSFIKKRFVMMHKRTSPARAALAQFSVLPLLAIAIFAFSDVTLAQIAPPPPPMEMGSSGLSPARVQEYHALLNKYVRRTKTTMALAQPSQIDGKKIIALQDAMSKAQVDTLTFKVYNPKLTPRQKPTKAEFEEYKNPNVYGIWLDGKKISNAQLDNYKAENIIQSFVSRVYANAQPKTGYKYKYQVDLMSEKYYDAYLREALEKPGFLIVKRDMFKQ